MKLKLRIRARTKSNRPVCCSVASNAFFTKPFSRLILAGVVLSSTVTGIPVLHSHLAGADWQTEHSCDARCIVSYSNKRIHARMINNFATILISIGLVGYDGSS